MPSAPSFSEAGPPDEHTFPPGWPSLIQAGCAAQETQDICRIRERRRSRLNVNSEFLVPSAPNFSEVGPPDEHRFPPGWPSLIQAGCAAQEILDIHRIRERRRSRLNVNSEFLVPSAPSFSEVGPPEEHRFPPGWPSLIQAGCAAQETQGIHRINE